MKTAQHHIASTALAILLTGCSGSQSPSTQTSALTTAPDFTLEDHGGRQVALTDLLSEGPAIVVFYRGHW